MTETMLESLDALIPTADMDIYPKAALPPGTFARSVRLDRLGVIIDAFYDSEIIDGQKIIIYSILLFPETKYFSGQMDNIQQYDITNEYEYEVIAYLMMNRLDISKLKSYIKGEGVL
tara:strand:- start:19 stop:369 length:351 start_codon:yes stop_codon:yes gene_type:complete